MTDERIPDKDSREIITVARGFAKLLSAGETLSAGTAVVTVSVKSGTDPNPNAMKSGSPSIVGSDVLQKIISGIDGNDYIITFEVQTSLGHKYVEAVILPVRDVD